MLENSATVLKPQQQFYTIHIHPKSRRYRKKLRLSLLDNAPNYLVGCVIQKRKNSVVKNRALNNAMIMAVFFSDFKAHNYTASVILLLLSIRYVRQKERKNWFTSQRSLTFLDPATKASFSSTILWDNLNLTVARSGSVEDGSRPPRLLRLPLPDVFMGFDMGEGGERPWWLRARTTKITVLEVARFFTV